MSNEMIRVCGWCGKGWEDVQPGDQVTHGIGDECFDRELADAREGKKGLNPPKSRVKKSGR